MTAASTAAPSLPPVHLRQRNAILATLLALAAIGWVVFLDQAREPMSMGAHTGTEVGTEMGTGMGTETGAEMGAGTGAEMGAGAGEGVAGGASHGTGPDLTMGGSWPLFAGTWVAMMAAMMFPAAAPMVLLYGRMRRHDTISVALFTGSYLALWTAFGGVAYLLSAGVESAASGSEWVAAHWGRVGGGLMVLAGAYQLTPLKDVCLRRCRSPLAFVLSHWRDGRAGAVSMGLTHGLFCMGCCWLLFLVLVPLGVMNVAAMVAVAVLVFVEKVAPWGRPAALAAGAVLVVAGLAVVVEPELLPTVA